MVDIPNSWMVYFMETPMNWWFRGTPILGNLHVGAVISSGWLHSSPVDICQQLLFVPLWSRFAGLHVLSQAMAKQHDPVSGCFFKKPEKTKNLFVFCKSCITCGLFFDTSMSRNTSRYKSHSYVHHIDLPQVLFNPVAGHTWVSRYRIQLWVVFHRLIKFYIITRVCQKIDYVYGCTPKRAFEKNLMRSRGIWFRNTVYSYNPTFNLRLKHVEWR